MRIAMVGNQAFAACNFRGPLIRHLLAQGHDVFVLAPDFDDALYQVIVDMGAVPLHYSLSRTGMNPFKDVFSVFSLWRVLRALRLDSVLCYFIKPVIYGTLAAALAGVPRRVALIEGAGYVYNDDATKSWKRRFLQAVVTWLYRLGAGRAHCVFVLNGDDRALFINKRIVRPDHLHMLPGIGVDLDHFRPSPVPAAPTVFCLAARLIEEKGVRVFVAAAREIKKTYPECEFLLLGGVETSPSAISPVDLSTWEREGVITSAGKVADVRPYLKRASVFVLPTYYREGLPRSILEAMAVGRAIITTDNPGSRDSIDDGVEGMLVPVRDRHALAVAMTSYVEDPLKVKAHGEAARKRAESRYDVRKINGVLSDALTGAEPDVLELR